jgi:hypothetical protein
MLMLQPFAKLHPQKPIIWKQMCDPLVVVWMPLIIIKYFENPRLEKSKFLRYIV